MNKAFDLILERLEDFKDWEDDSGMPIHTFSEVQRISKCKEIVQAVAEEYNGGWITCNERLPEENQEVILQDIYGNTTIETMKINNGINGFSDGDWWSSANNYIAWHPIPEPYKERD